MAKRRTKVDQPDAERTISDVDTLRALSDPLRLRILEVMVQRTDEPWSVKELAAATKVPQTRLYHHVELLVERELIRPVEKRVVQGIIETRYRVAALSLRLDRRLFAGGTPETDAAVREALAAVFDSARDEIETSIRAGRLDMAEGADSEHGLLLAKGLVRLTPERAAKLRLRLREVIEEFESDATLAEPDAVAFGTLLALYPLAEPTDPDEPTEEHSR